MSVVCLASIKGCLIVAERERFKTKKKKVRMKFTSAFVVLAALASAASAFYVPETPLAPVSNKRVSLSITKAPVEEAPAAFYLADTEVKVCSKSTDLFNIESLNVPDPIYINRPLRIGFTGDASRTFGESGKTKINITVKLGIITVLKEELDLCDLIADVPEAENCPIEKGRHDLDVVVADSLPSIVPSGTKLKISVVGVEDQKDEIFCLDITATLRKA